MTKGRMLEIKELLRKLAYECLDSADETPNVNLDDASCSLNEAEYHIDDAIKALEPIQPD